METKFINNKQIKIIDELKRNIQKGSKISIISAYFTIYAFNELKKELSKTDNIRLLFTETTYKKQNTDLLRQYYISRKINSNTIFGSEFEIKLKNELKQSVISKDCANLLNKKAEIKALKKPNSAQPRMIYIENETNNDLLINGTVDFSSEGLGITSSDRIDSNIAMKGSKEELKIYLENFNTLWNNDNYVENIKQSVLEHIELVYKENTPQFIYFITLYNIFSESINELTEENIFKSKTGFKESKIWNKLYKFQKDAVIGILDKLNKYNGCILADSVGLGKTFTALAVIKYYELRNCRVLVLAPKRLRENWIVYNKTNDTRNILDGDNFRYDVLNHTDLSRQTGYTGDINLETINWGNYDLVVIDESHNFRNNTPYKDKKTRYQKLMEDIILSGVKTKVLLLSATPINNKFNDLKNQIAFITGNNDTALKDVGINSIENTLKQSQQKFNTWAKLPDIKRTTKEFLNSLNIEYFKLLDTLTLARSRKHILKYYDSKEIGEFPNRLKPINKKTDIDLKNLFPNLKEINKKISKLNLAIYTPISYLLPEKVKEYEQKYDILVRQGKSIFKQKDREKYLVHLMRVNMLKRMESSINSFTITVSKMIDSITTLLKKLENDKFNYNVNIDINDIDLDDNEYEDIMIGKNVKVLIKDIDLIKWKQALQEDKEKLEELKSTSQQIDSSRDAKLKELKELITAKINNPINSNNKKIIIFSAFADTTEYLYKNLSQWILEKFNLYTAMVSGSGQNKTNMPKIKATDTNSILINFSPISKERALFNPNQTGQIDILIATDCVSEGQNLQDCDYLINWDIHWNPVRIIQRFGRIDRIGSKNKNIQLVNFWPNLNLDEYIGLISKVKTKMVMVDTSATGEENIIEDNKTKDMNDLEYRKNQLLKLQEQVIDLEDISGNISITDLTLNDFKTDLMEYLKNNKILLEQAPTGMYAVINLPDDLKNELEQGVIFTLKQIKGTISKSKNVLAPYYVVYISKSGEIKYTTMQTKQILDFYKKLCATKTEIVQQAVTDFNKETKNGFDMEEYSQLLKTCIENIIGEKIEDGKQTLFKKGKTTLSSTQSSSLQDFELISFLIIK